MTALDRPEHEPGEAAARPRPLIVDYLASTRELIASVAARRRLLIALARRDIADDYVQHRFSSAWAIVMPLFTVAVYVFVFTVIFPARVKAPQGLETDALVYLLAGILPWVTLSLSCNRSVGAIVNNSNIVKQMSFPLELLALKTLVSPMLFLCVGLGIVIAYGGVITAGKILPFYLIGAPLAFLLTLVFLAACALGLSALQVFLRDAKEFVTMFFSLGLFLHPILYLPDAIPGAVRGVVYASPVSYFLFCWQDVLFYGGFHRPWAWGVAALVATLGFILAARLFMSSKAHFGEFL